MCPFEEPNAKLVVAAERAGGLGILDLGRDSAAALSAIRDVTAWWAGAFGVRIPSGCAIGTNELPALVDTVVLPFERAADPEWSAVGRRVLVEVTSRDEARQAVALGAFGIVARGNEGGGLVGEVSTFVLIQQIASDPLVTVPVWAAGGIGAHTAAAAVAGGAHGVVLDSQLALTSEVELPRDVAAAIRAMDGSETTVVGKHRVYVRPDLPVARLSADDDTNVAGRLGARDLRTQFLPIGQDGPVAARFARKHVTTGGVVQAIQRSIDESIATADAARPLAADSRFAREHAVRVPIAQGPMTHVSDKAQFAAAIAGAGGLPFLALSLMNRDTSRALLDETATLLAGKSWGAGILGFVPAEVRDGQLEAILAVRPPFALIAGGRPAQAKELEAAGIPTFLHVPSPGLLDQFLDAGSRRFVFEGRECGGHVGPRSSFALWEAQVDRLLAYGAGHGGDKFFGQLHVLLAGGVHDDRSAAMVAALTAPLAEKGAGIGVLMGTAYLFTEEARDGAAITPSFQDAVLACDRTVLLETSPGHSTRCVDTSYVTTFTRTKRRLIQDGVTQQEMWAELERLNLGRLRLASKGLRREGDHIVAVSDAIQRSDGMVMVGDVAMLRNEVTTVAALHKQVSLDGTKHLADRAAELGLTDRPSTTSGADPLDIAIVGMACVFPEAADAAQYWSNIVAGVDAITEVSPDRWDPQKHYDPKAGAQGAGRKTPSKWGGFLPDLPFDALEYGIPPTSLIGIEPMQLLALQAATQALRDAGYGEREFDRTKTSVVFGAEAGADLGTSYGFRAVYETYFGSLPPALDAHLPALTEDSFPGVLANVIAGRIANRLDLGGANFTVDAACAASLAALDVACSQLRTGTSDMVLCGAADTHNGIYDYLLFAAVHALSPSGRCATFDVEADGIALGEGVGCVVLKRLADAERDGDRIYAVVKGIAGSSDGRSLGLTAPRADGQRLAMERAYLMAGVSPAEVGLVEAHGTGTTVGDRTELAALTSIFAEAGAEPGACALGSVKSQIGHTKCAAGIASLIKMARAVYTGVRPPTGNLKQPTSFWDRETSPFFFDTAARPWAAPADERNAGISAFGFGGSNFHAVLSGYRGAPEPAHGLDQWPAELFLFRGADRAVALREMDRLAELMTANEDSGRPWRLRDLARTISSVNTGRELPVQSAVVAESLTALATKLRRARQFETDATQGIFAATPNGVAGGVAFVFPGQGSQRVGMLADLFVAFPRLQRLLALGSGWAETIFPATAFDADERARQRRLLDDTAAAQPALGIAGLAMYELLTAVGVRPDAVAGHSYGELVALCVAGAFTDAELVELSQARGHAIVAATQSVPGADPGAMIAVSAAPDKVLAVVATDEACEALVVANHNAPRQSALSGPTAAVEAAMPLLAAHGMSATRLSVACAFHSPLVAAAADELAVELDRVAVASPSIPVWSNTLAAAYPQGADPVRELLARQVAEPVRFAEQIQAMHDAGVRTFVEVGPGRVLTGLVDKILVDREHVAVATDVPGEAGITRLLTALAQLATSGVAVDPELFFHGRDAKFVSVRAVPRRPGWILNGYLVRTADGAYLPGGYQPARNVPQPLVASTVSSTDLSRRDDAVMDYLRNSREMMAAQRDVMLGFLGAPASVNAVEAAPPQLPVVIEQPALETEAALVNVAVEVTSELAMATVREIVSERTGYPEDMLDADLDLEADLSIDSIKRIEIFGALNERLAALGAASAGVDESAMEELVRFKTLTGIVGWIVDRAENGAAPEQSESPTEPTEQAPLAIRRYVARIEDLPTLESPDDAGADLPTSGRRFVILGDGLGVGVELTDLLEEQGASAVIADPNRSIEALRNADAVVHLGALTAGAGPVLPDGFATLRQAALGSADQIIVVTDLGGRFGRAGAGNGGSSGDVGLHGLVRTMAREFPEVSLRAVDVDPKDSPARIAQRIYGELCVREDRLPDVVGYRDGVRAMLRVVEAPLDTDESIPTAAALGLGPESVVVLTGGARGVTARVAIGLAKASGCRVELVGRTAEPSGVEAPATAHAADRPALRRTLIEQGIRDHAEIEAVSGRLLAEREIRANLAELRVHATSARYHQADVRDANAVRKVIEDVYARHGRIDGAVHGAGVLEDKLIRDKSSDSFDRVYRTKVDGATALVDALPADVGFLVLFGSVSGVWGNRGQADYAAANDALDSLAHRWSEQFDGRVISIDWGPWAPSQGGMVSAELEREYARRGIGVIGHDDGVACLLRELAADASDAQVIYLCGASDAFESTSAVASD